VHRCFVLAATFALAAALTAGLHAGQSPASATPSAGRAGAKAWTTPRTPWGDPDLQGLWPATEMQGTPYERPAELGGSGELTEAQYAERLKRARAAITPQSWAERQANPSRQASIVVDPPEGKIPPMTPEGLRRAALARSTYYFDFPGDVVAHPFDNFDDLGPYDRCISRGVVGGMLPTLYSMGTEIMQVPGYVVIRNEMIHETRAIPLDGHQHISPKIRQYMGDSRGHFVGDTLVIETTNFNGKVGLTHNGNTNITSPDFVLTERMTRVAQDTLRYEATINDPTTYTKPWKVAIPLKLHPEYQMFEYACHEGNYALKNILSAERAADRQRDAP
jgi:hypothetical protein